MGLPLDRTYHFRGITNMVVGNRNCTGDTVKHRAAPFTPGAYSLERSRTENRKNRSVERLGGIEPPSPGWKPGALPMSYSRVSAGGRPPAFSGGGKMNSNQNYHLARLGHDTILHRFFGSWTPSFLLSPIFPQQDKRTVHVLFVHVDSCTQPASRHQPMYVTASSTPGR